MSTAGSDDDENAVVDDENRLVDDVKNLSLMRKISR
jgi:hypothetical protein